ncbi:phage tail protein, partial [Streptococcus sp. HF-2466]|uniref:phage tail protein n=1 Tax=Streptococcus sp. HF-2466 TaxID=2785792 RepID=UPI00189F47DF
MSKRNVRIAIRDTTDSHNVGFFDNKSGIKYNSANLTQFLKGACSVLVLTYHSKKMVAQSGQKLAFRFKDKDFWLNINSVKKTGYKIELTAYSLSLEANKEKRGPHKPANAMSIKQYIDYYDPEHSFEIGINEVADKSIKLEWSGTDTILARLYSVANSFGAELEFVTELNNDYSLKRHVVNIYREGNLGKDKTGMPVRVGEKLKVINYSDNMDDFYTGIRRTGKDGLTIAGLNKKIYDDKGNLLFYSSGDTLYAPQARDKYPSIARKTNDGYIINEDSETEHTSKEALFGYMLSELKKHCELKVDYEVEGAVDGSIGDRKTLIDGQHFDPPLYVQARISEQTEALLETSDVKTTLSNYVRKSSQIANELLQRVEQLTLEATPYTIKLATNNGIVFKNNQGQSTIYPSLKRGQKPVECTWKWLVDNQGFGTSPTFEVKAAGMSSKLVLTAIALVDNKEVAREQVTFTNVNDGAKGSDGKSITVAKAEKQADGVKVTFSDNKSIVVPKGDKGDKGDPADPVPLNALQEEMKRAKQGLNDVKADLLKEKAESSANIEQVKKEVGAISSQQTAYEKS